LWPVVNAFTLIAYGMTSRLDTAPNPACDL
jgi:hypothetical protein